MSSRTHRRVPSARAAALSLPSRSTACRYGRSAASSRRRARTGRRCSLTDSVATALSRAARRLVADMPLRVCPGAPEQPCRLVLGGGERNGVGTALAHLLAVQAEQQ